MLLIEANCTEGEIPPDAHSLKGSVCKQYCAERSQVEEAGKLCLHYLFISEAVGNPSLCHIGGSNPFPLLSSVGLAHGLD